MASQEDFLDDLLKDMNTWELDETASDDDILTEGNAVLAQMELPSLEFADMEQEPVTADGDADTVGVGDFMSMSEDEIEKFLAMEANSEVTDNIDAQDESGEEIDLMELLGQTDDSNLQEIHELLQKSDNNEAIVEKSDQEAENASEDYMNLLGEIAGENQDQNSGMSEKEKKAQERRDKLEERKATREANKQAKLEAKQEAKAAKEAEKAAKKAEKLAKKAEKKAGKKVKDEPTESQEILLENDINVDANLDPNAQEIHAIANDDLADIEALLSLSGGDGAASAGDVFGMPMESVLPFATESEVESIEEIFDADESKVTITQKEGKKSGKKGWFARFVEFITEEDEEEAEQGNENVQMSDENKNIIEEMDKKKKKKKGKKGKAKKGEAAADKEGATEDDGTGEDAENAEKNKKNAKKKKVKKEKVTEEVLEEPTKDKNGSNITFKKVMPIAMVCLSIGIVIVLLAELSGDFSVKRAGREAYYEGDYQTCYQNLYGKELNESEQVMYSKSESILRMRLWYREYELLVEEGSEAGALDSLLESVKNYPDLYSYASEWNAGTEVAEIYAKMLTVLSDKYRLTEEQAIEIANTQNDVEYSKKIYTIVDGGAYGSWDKQPEVEVEESLRDVLPEEEELDDVLFLENSGTE